MYIHRIEGGRGPSNLHNWVFSRVNTPCFKIPPFADSVQNWTRLKIYFFFSITASKMLNSDQLKSKNMMKYYSWTMNSMIMQPDCDVKSLKMKLPQTSMNYSWITKRLSWNVRNCLVNVPTRLWLIEKAVNCIHFSQFKRISRVFHIIALIH